MSELTPPRSKAVALEAFERSPNKDSVVPRSAHVPAARDGFLGRVKSVAPRMRYENVLIGARAMS
jgi:hypothetical protein